MITNRTNDSSSNKNNIHSGDNNDANKISVGRLVDVQSRTWPGINKLGGIARVTAVHCSPCSSSTQVTTATTTTTTPPLLSPLQPSKLPTINSNSSINNSNNSNNISHVDVHYIVERRKEKRVPIEYVTLAPQYEQPSDNTDATASAITPTSIIHNNHVIYNNNNNNNNKKHGKFLRDRSMLLGRCRRCGSLRTDCGSCDWAQLEVAEPTKQQSQLSSSRRTSVQYTIHNATNISTTTTNKSMRSNRTIPLSLSSTSSSSSDSDSDREDALLKELIDNNTKRYKRYMHQRYKCKQTFDEGSSVSSASSECSAVASPVESSDSGEETSKHQRLIRNRRDASNASPQAVSQAMSVSSNDEQDQFISEYPTSPPFQNEDSPLRSDMAQRWITEAQNNNQNDNSNSNDNDNDDDHYDEASEGNHQYHRHHLSDFIQPEGDAQCLPNDIIDRTKGLAYVELPTFFDHWIQHIQDEILPDAKLTIAKLCRNVRDVLSPRCRKRQIANNPQNGTDTTAADSNVTRQTLAKECHATWVDIRKRLIRDGIDQCRTALLRLEDDRLYAKHKRRLTVRQRKLCRGRRRVEARNLQLDSVEDAAEDLSQRIQRLLKTCEQETDNFNGINKINDSSNAHHDDYDIDSDEDKAQDDLFRIIDSDTEHDNLQEQHEIPHDLRSLSPWKPHVYATRIRTNKESAKLRPQTRVRDGLDWLVDDQPTGKRNHTKRCRRRLRNHQKEKDQKPKRKSVSGRMKSIKSDEHATPQGLPVVEDQSAEPFESLEVLDDGIGMAAASDLPSHQEQRQPRKRQRQDELSVGIHRSDRIDFDCQIETRDSSLGLRMSEQSHRQQPGMMQSSHRTSGRDREPVLKRMERFLEANSDSTNIQSMMSDEQHPKQGHTWPTKRRDRQDEPQRPLGDIEEQSDGELVDTAEPFLAEQLFARLRNRTTASAKPRSTFLVTQKDVSECCQELHACYPHDQSRAKRALDMIHMILIADERTNVESSAREFLSCSWTLLVSHGLMTLQELVVAESPLLPLHVRLLSECLCALERCPDGIAASDGFHWDRKFFVRALILQFVDSVYSVLHPQPWGLQRTDFEKLLSDLSPLRDALAKVASLTELVCRCLLEDLPCQKWRCGYAKSQVYISCVDPASWKTLLTSGKLEHMEHDVRFAGLGKRLPRAEVDALWLLLAYCGASQSPPEERTYSRWQVISKLFSAGVLASSNIVEADNVSARPSQAQLDACETELSHLFSLLSVGALDSIPGTDSILVNLVQRVLVLQSDGCANQNRLQPLERKLVRSVWKATDPFVACFASGQSIASKSTSVRDMSHALGGGEETRGLSDLLLPPSRILRRCLGIVSLWIGRIPAKKARRVRLSKSIASIANNLINEAMKAEGPPMNVVGNSFEAAFGVGGLTESVESKSIFFREAVAYIRIVAALAFEHDQTTNSTCAGFNCSDEDLRLQVWNLLADDALNKRYRSVVCGTPLLEQNDVLYKGSIVRSLVTAKVMAFLALAKLGIEPWNVSVVDGLSLSVTDKPAGGLVKDVLANSVSGVIACLECLCDMKCQSEHITHVYMIIVTIYTNVTALLAVESLEAGIFTSIENLGRISLSLFVPTLIKCFRQHTTCIDGRVQSDNLQIRGFFAVLRGMLALSTQLKRVACLRSDEDDGANENVTATEEVWGQLNDSAFTNIDLAEVERTTRSPPNAPGEALQELCFLLCQSVELSKPSHRYAISRPAPVSPGSFQREFSVNGKMLIAKHMHMVCDCLSAMFALRASDWLSGATKIMLKNLLSPRSRQGRKGDQECDVEYFNKVSERLSFMLCCFAEKFRWSRAVVFKNSEEILFNFIEATLDSSILEGFPSCNLRRIQREASETASQQARVLLDFANTFRSTTHHRTLHSDLAACYKQRRRQSLEFWCFAKAFGRVVRHSVEDMFESAEGSVAARIGAIILDEVNHAQSTAMEQVCMENEALKRFKMVCAIISASKVCSINKFAFERLSSLAIATTCSQTLRITQSLLYHDRACNAEDKSDTKDFRRAKLVELLSTCSETMVAVIAWTMSESIHAVNNEKTSWASLITCIQDRLLCPILLKQKNDIVGALYEIIDCCGSILPECRKCDSAQRIESSLERSKYLHETLWYSCVRRSREFMVFISTEQGASLVPKSWWLLKSILAVAVDIDISQGEQEWVTSLVGRSLFCQKSVNKRSPFCHLTRLQEGIDEYIENFNRVNAGDTIMVCSMENVKRYSLEVLLIPRLTRPQTSDPETSRRTVRLIQNILKSSLKPCRQNRYPFCCVAQGIVATLEYHLGTKVINNDLVAAIFFCCRQLAHAPVQDEAHRRTLKLVNWSNECEGLEGSVHLSGEHGEAGEDVSKAYLWTFFRWIFAVGKLLDDEAESGRSLEWFRRSCKAAPQNVTAQNDRKHFEDAQNLRFRMYCLEKHLFPQLTTTKVQPKIINVYAKTASDDKADDGPLEPWFCSSRVHRATKEFMADIIPLL